MTRIWLGVVFKFVLIREGPIFGFEKWGPGNLSGILGKGGDDGIIGLLHKDAALHKEPRRSLARHCWMWPCVPFEC